MMRNVMLTPNIVLAQTLLLLRERCDDVPASACATMDFDARDLTLSLNEYADRVLIPVAGQLSDPASSDGKPRSKPLATVTDDGTSLSVWELYDIGIDRTSWHFRAVRT
jgi:hypothetical protein